MSANIVTTLPLGPLDPERTELLLRVVDGLEPATLQWLSGFAAGVAHERAAGRAAWPRPAGPVAAPAARAEATARLTIVYGSQTGNSKRIAERLGRAAEAAGLAARVYASGHYRSRTWRRSACSSSSSARRATAIRRTTPAASWSSSPRGARPGSSSWRSPCSRWAIPSYPKFCETGRQVDERLAALGARRCSSASTATSITTRWPTAGSSAWSAARATRSAPRSRWRRSRACARRRPNRSSRATSRSPPKSSPTRR